MAEIKEIDIKERQKETVELFKECSPFFVAMGDTIRQQLLLDIGTADELGVNVNYLGKRVRLSRPAVSYHLKILKDTGLVSTTKIGTQVYYHLSLEKKFSTVKKLVAAIDELIASKAQSTEQV
jgi:DNA-binding transcriptional ArsR family regulator